MISELGVSSGMVGWLSAVSSTRRAQMHGAEGMKLNRTSYETIVAAMRGVKGNHQHITPETYKRDGIGKDTDKRFRWDALSAARNYGGPSATDLYKQEGINDDHIDTALRRAVKEVWG